MPELHPPSFLWRLSLRHPRVVLAALLLLTLLAGLEARHLRLKAGIDLLPAEDPLVRENRQRLAIFGPDPRLIVALHRPMEEGGVLHPPSLEALRALHAALEELPGVGAVSSLANAPVLSPPAPPEPEAFTGSAPPLFDPPVPGEPVLTAEALADRRALLHRLGSSEVGKLMLLSLRQSLTPLYLELSEGAPEAEVVGRVLDLAAEIEDRHPEAGRILVVGPAVVETALAGHVFDDLGRLVPFSLALVAGGLLLAFRRRIFLAAALLHALALEALLLGTMAALGWSLNLVSVLAPVLLVPVGVADLLHLFARLGAHERRAAGGDAREHLARAFASLEAPMLATTLTTALGFLSFLLSPVAALRQFGATLALGALLALLLTFTLDAAFLSLSWKVGERGARIRRSPWHWPLPPADPARLRRRAGLALGLAALLGALATTALPRIQIEDTWIDNFDPGSRVVRDARLFEKELFGTNILSLVFEADPAVPGSREHALEAVNRFTTEHTVTRGLRGLLSPTLLLRALDPAQGLAWESWPTPTREKMAAGIDTWRARGMALPDIDRLATEDLDRLQVQLFVLDQPYPRLAETQERLLREAREAAGPGVRIRASGDLALNIRMVRQTVRGQLHSLLALVATVTAMLMLLARSPTAGLVLALPMLLSIAGSFCALLWLDLPYGIAVSMFPTLVVGLSVDFAIHLRSALARRQPSVSPRTPELRAVLRGILWNGLLWSAGFALLMASALPPNRSLGLLAALVIALSTLTTLALLPAFAWLLNRPHPHPATEPPALPRQAA